MLSFDAINGLNGLTPYENVLLYLNTDIGKSMINPLRKTSGPNT